MKLSDRASATMVMPQDSARRRASAVGAEMATTMGMPTETIEGVIRGGTFYSGMSEKLQKLAPWKLADRYVVIDEGRVPSWKKAGMLLGIGTGLLGWMSVVAARRFSPTS